MTRAGYILASDARFRLLANAMPQMVWVASADGAIEYVNDRWTEYTGRSVADSVGTAWMAALHPDDVDGVIRLTKASLASGAPFESEYRLRRHDGAYRWQLARAARVREDGVERWFGTTTDIDDAKRLHDMVRESDQRKSEFLAVLSHELRNPLAPIRNALWLLDHASPDTDQAVRAKETINRQILHLTRIVDDLLDLTRISRGKVQLQRTRLDLVELARRAVDDHHPLFGARDVRLVDRLPDLPIWLEADSTRLAQVVSNLLTNAAKFSDAGSVVEVEVERDAGGAALVRVRDQGIGIPPELIGRIFDAFTQADTSLHRSRGGLGLGLSLVKGLVEMHGGTVVARSDGERRGAEFVVRLPVAPESPALRDAVLPASGGGPHLRVLVVEDNADAAETLRDMLELWGHEVEVAHDGAAGVAKARALHPDVLLCDIGLPAMDGYEVARTIRRDPELAATYLVAVTGYALPEDQRRAADAGFNRHLGKPVPIEAIEDVLATVPRARASPR